MGRRTVASIKKENAKFKGLYEGLYSLVHSDDFMGLNQGQKQILIAMMHRAEYMGKIATSMDTGTTEKDLDDYYAKLEKYDQALGSISSENRQMMEKMFEEPANEALLKKNAWHAAYAAFMFTKNLEVTKEAQEIFDVRQTVKEAKQKEESLKEQFEAAVKKEKEKNPNLDPKKLAQELRKLGAEESQLLDEIREISATDSKAKHQIQTFEKSLNAYKNDIEKFDKETKERKESVEILTQIVDFIEKKGEHLSALYNEYDAVSAQSTENTREENKALNETRDASYEVSAVKKEFNGLKKDASPAFLKRLELAEKIREVYEIQDKMGNAKMNHSSIPLNATMEEFCKVSSIDSLLKKFAKKYNKDYETLRSLTEEEFDDEINAIADEMAEGRDLLNAALTEEEKNKFMEVAGRYNSARADYFDKLADYVEKREEKEPIMDDLKKKNDAINEFTESSYAKLLGNKRTHYLTVLDGRRILTPEGLEKCKKALEKAKMELVGVEETFEETKQKLSDTQKAYDAYMTGPEVQISKKHDALKEKHAKVLSVFDAKLEEREKLMHLKEITEGYKAAINERKALPSVNESKLTDKISESAANLYGKRALRQGSHTNSREYDRMIAALDNVQKWTKGEGTGSQKEALSALEKEAAAYLVAKSKQFRFSPSVMRMQRLEYANAIVAFAQQSLEEMDRAEVEKDVVIQQDMAKDVMENDENVMEELESYNGL